MAGGSRAYRTIDTTPEMSAEEAWQAARPILVKIRARETIARETIAGESIASDNGDLTFAQVAEEVFRRHGRRWKPRTIRVNRDYLKSCLLPVLPRAEVNIIIKTLGRVQIFRLFVWVSLVPIVPMLLMSLAIEGPQIILETLSSITPPGVVCLLYLAFASTLFCYAG